jgi:mycothiol synthase
VTDLSWRPGLDEAEIREVHELAAAATAEDGTAPLSEHVLMHLGGGDAIHLMARDGDALVAVAHLDLSGPVDRSEAEQSGSGELTVRPGSRRAGLGTRMVEELLRAVSPGGSLQLWAHGEHPGAVRIAEHLGFARARVLWQLRRSLKEPLADPEPVPGVRIRAFEVGADEAEFLRVNNAAFDWHPEQGGWVVDDVTVRESEPWFDPAGFLLAEDGSGRLLGYHWTKVHEADDSHERLGEVYVLGVDPSARGMHLGATLTLAGLHHLRDRGLDTVMLYVEADNDAAVRLYHRLGFALWHTDVLFAK